MSYIPDIPRVYTALAEWCACLVYLLPLPGRVRGVAFAALSAGMLVVQAALLVATGYLPLPFWLPAMALAVLLMFGFLWLATRRASVWDSGYRCTLAFVLAELIASLEWQIHCFFWPDGRQSLPGCGVLAAVYAVAFLAMYSINRRYAPAEPPCPATRSQFLSALIIGVAAFSVSNLSYLPARTPFSVEYGTAVLQLRTLVDFGGMAILFAHQLQCRELNTRRELQAVQNTLQNHYLQYRQSKESIELINRKYHDLKHQIGVLRAESDAARRNEYLDQIEADIRRYEVQNKTGNPVLDTLLTSKGMVCAQKEITLTCVANGVLLDGMQTMDLCTLVGNALDNAIECEEQIPGKEKRLIHLSLSRQQDFVLFRVENYCETPVNFRNGWPATTKKDKTLHGYGLKSIRYVAQKYGGSATATQKDNWFTLRVLLPFHEGAKAAP